MWNRTKATQILGIEYPIIQGPFGGRFSSAKLTSIVSNTGGMGSFGLNAYSPEEILTVNNEIRVLTRKTYALNLWVPLKDDPATRYPLQDLNKLTSTYKPYFDALNIAVPEIPQPMTNSFELQIEAILKAKPPVMSFIFGIPAVEIIQELKSRNIVTIATATTLEEALLIEEAGIDLVIASGAEAGGHRASFLKPAEESLTKTLPLVEQVAKHVNIPVIAAGGISDGVSLHAAMKAGAAAVQMGTAFLATKESNATTEHKTRLLSREPLQTTLTKVYSGRLARALSNSLIEDFSHASDDLFAPYPIHGAWLRPLSKAAVKQKKWEYVAFWSGQPSAVLKHRSAEQLILSLVQEVSEVWN